MEELFGDIEIVLDDVAKHPLSPQAWRALVGASSQERLDAFHSLFASVAPLMPKSAQRMKETLEDAYVVHARGMYILIGEFGMPGKTTFYRSLAPVSQTVFGGTVGKFYENLNGFCDIFGLGGILPIQKISELAEAVEKFAGSPSGPAVEQLVVQDQRLVFVSGGAGYGYADAPSTFTDTPLAHRLWLNSESPRINLDFWELMDRWTAGAMR